MRTQEREERVRMSGRMSGLADSRRVLQSRGPRVLLLLLLCLAPGSALRMTGRFNSASVKGTVELGHGEPTSIDFEESFIEAAKRDAGPPGSLTAMMVIPMACGEARDAAGHGSSALTYIIPSLTKVPFGEGKDKIEDESLFSSDVTTSVVIVKCQEGAECKAVEEVIDCAELVTYEEEEGLGLSTEIIIILIVVGIVLLLIIICVPIICCCLRRRRHTGEKGDKIEVEVDDGDSVDDPFLMNGRQSKSEISIPYMDASLPPTPKGGRSGFRLEDLLGNNNRNSASSISEKPM